MYKKYKRYTWNKALAGVTAGAEDSLGTSQQNVSIWCQVPANRNPAV